MTDKEAFERAAKVHLWQPGPFLRDCNDIDATRDYELTYVDDAWKMWKAARVESAEEIQRLKRVIAIQRNGLVTIMQHQMNCIKTNTASLMPTTWHIANKALLDADKENQ